MDKTIYGFSTGDVQRLRRAVRFIEDNATMLKSYRRIRGQQAGGTLRMGVISTSGVDGNNFFLGYLLTPNGDKIEPEIEVNCQDAELDNVVADRYFLAVQKRVSVDAVFWF